MELALQVVFASPKPTFGAIRQFTNNIRASLGLPTLPPIGLFQKPATTAATTTAAAAATTTAAPTTTAAATPAGGP